MKFKLYIEGLKQLRVIGIMALVIFSLEAVFMGIQQGISYSIDGKGYTYRLMTLFDIHPIIVLSFTVLAPIMTLFIFSFLNKRNSCDFYHSSPVSRKKIFLSYFMAIITWILVVLIISTLLSYITSLFFPGSFQIQLSGALMSLFGNFAASVLVVSAVAFAMCITGTIFTNILVSIMILFVPRLFITIIQTMITSSLPMISSKNVISFLELKYNIVCNSVFNVFIDSSQITKSFYEPECSLYTLILGLIYGFIAYLLFIKRKSEAAGLSAPNNILQTIYRVIIALTVCLIPIGIFYGFLMNDYDNDPTTILAIIISYIFAVIMVIIFELVSTRKVKNILKIFPSLGIVLILNIIIFFAMAGIYRAVLNTTPQKNDISYVNIISTGDLSSSYGYDYYFDIKKSELNITDSSIKKLVSNSLKENIEMFKKSPDSYYAFTASAYGGINVSIKEGMLKYDRFIYFNKEDYDKLLDALNRNQDFASIYKDLPELSDDNFISMSDDYDLNQKAIEDIYNKMREEVSNMELKDLIFLMNPDYNYDSSDKNYFEVNSLYLAVAYNGISCNLNLPINNYLPETTKEYFNQLENKNKENFDRFLDLINYFPETDYQLDLYITTTNMGKDNFGGPEKFYSYYWQDETNNNIKESMLPEFYDCLEIIKGSEGVPSDISDKFMRINIGYYDKKDSYESFSFYILPKSQEDIIEILNVLNNLSDESGYVY